MSKTVFISAGHGGTDPGCVANGHKESDLALSLRERVAANLRGLNVRAITDGKENQNLPLTEAIKLVKQNNGPSIELHFNASEFEKISGVEVLSLPEMKPLAQQLGMAISAVLQIPARGHLGYRAKDSGQHHRLGFVEAGGLIVEVCFMTNSRELNNYLYHDEEVAVAIAQVLAKAANT